MKSIYSLIILLLIISPSNFQSIGEKTGAANAAQSGQEAKRYKIKSGIIEYKITGMQSGTEILYFDDWGRKEAKYTNTEISVMNIKQKQNQLGILDGNITYTIDLDRKTGTKMDTPLMGDLSRGAKRQGKDMTDVGMEMLKQMGGEKVGEEKVAGYLCEVYEIKKMSSKTWVHNGVTLKMESNMVGMQRNQEATRVQLNVPIPQDKLRIPSDVTITEMPNPLKSRK
jgi:hypothetical protein